MEERININENNKRKLEVFLLYGQALDIHRSYYQEFGDRSINSMIEKYYLIDKTWLDKYKSENNYDLIIPDVEHYNSDDYQTFKSKIMNRFKKNNNKKALKISYPRLKGEVIPEYQIMVPENFVIVKKEIFESYFLNFESTYGVIIGETNIFIFDIKTENSKFDNIYICSIKYDDYSDDITNFKVNVDYLLIFKKEFTVEERGNFFDLIKNGKGINNYFKIKKLNNKKYGEQPIYGNNKQKVGYLFSTTNNKNYLEEKKISEKFLNEYLNKVNPKKSTEIIFNSIDEINISNFSMQKQNNSKCITIYGNLYYYLNNDNDDNCEISEYSNINHKY